MTSSSYRCVLRDDRCLPLPYHCVAQDCNLVHHKRPPSARPSIFMAPSTASMTSTAPHHVAVSLLCREYPGLTIQDLEPIPSSPLQLQYHVKVSDGQSLLLTLPSPAVMRLLRSEETAIEAEAAVLKYLATSLRDIKSRARIENVDGCAPVSLRGKKSISSRGQGVRRPLQQYIPVMVKNGWTDGERSTQYRLSRPPNGEIIANLTGTLSYRERQSINYQIGQLLARLSTQLSPNRKFGPAADVLSVRPSEAHLLRLEGSLNLSKGATSWSIAFRTMLESVLRDGEDSSVMISYATIRRHLNRFEQFLDDVETPRLVVVDAGEDTNTLVIRDDQTCQKESEELKEEASDSGSIYRTSEDSGFFEGSEYFKNISVESEPTDDDHDEDDIMKMKRNTGNGNIEVTGLRQWTNCIFGDPLIALPFTNYPSNELWAGFNTHSSPDTVIQDEPSTRVRLLLYECYHAVVAVMRGFYRPQADGGKSEMRARRRLVGVLERLDDLGDNGVVRRRRRMSGEMSPAKRQRHSDDESDGS